MSRKVIVELKVKLSMIVNEGNKISDIIDGLDYDFDVPDNEADIIDTEITDYEVIDSK